MKSGSLILTLALMFATSAFAQQGNAAGSSSDNSSNTQSSSGRVRGAHRGGGKRMKHVAKELNLTEDQKAKMKSSMQAQHQQMKAIQGDTSLSADQKKAKVKELHEQSRADFQAMLTPDQQQKWQEIKKDHKNGRQGKKDQS